MSLGAAIIEGRARRTLRHELEAQFRANGVEIDDATWAKVNAALADVRLRAGAAEGPPGRHEVRMDLSLTGLDRVERVLREAIEGAQQGGA